VGAKEWPHKRHTELVGFHSFLHPNIGKVLSVLRYPLSILAVGFPAASVYFDKMRLLGASQMLYNDRNVAILWQAFVLFDGHHPKSSKDLLALDCLLEVADMMILDLKK
jgi:hypothetical protein